MKMKWHTSAIRVVLAMCLFMSAIMTSLGAASADTPAPGLLTNPGFELPGETGDPVPDVVHRQPIGSLGIQRQADRP
ncbi:MAG: hypothetical protein K0Q59_1240 [Paenibacillus sp.]|nr:hypothetical protein [Paenibacillus sp.]